MKRSLCFLVLLAVQTASAPATAQQGGIAVSRERGSKPGTDQLAQSGPDAGVRRPPGGGASTPAIQAPVGTKPAEPVIENTGRPPPVEVAQSPTGGAKPLSPAETAALSAALKAVDEGRWADARAAVANFRLTLLDRYVEWSILRTAPKSDARFAATWRFLRENPDWPEPEVLRRQAEDRIGPETAPSEVFRYFTAFPPLTSTGHLRRLDAAQTVSPADMQKLASDSWRTATFRNSDESDFFSRYGQHLSGADQIARFDRILLEGRPQVARELLSRLPPDYQPVAEARLAMAAKATDAATLLRALPAAKLQEPVLQLERAQWLRRTGNLEELKTLLAKPVANPSDAWWTERNQLARDLLGAGRAADAYAIVAPHGLSKGVAFAEAEFLAGWIALRQLKKTADAQKHFQTLHDGVATDISKSRAAYWLGRTHEAANRAKEAGEWYGRAAAYGQTFYGQLAARKLPGAAPRLPVDPSPTAAERQSLANRELVTLARYLGQSGEYDRARPFLLRLARTVTVPGEVALLAQLALELKRPDVALTIARRGAENGVVLFDATFPMVELGATGALERALALALTRQESSFNAAAVSSSGALGLMQLLPGTARDVAGRLNIPFIQDKLTRDPAYNVQIGSQYMAEMLGRFGGSYEIALAAYNAGPNRVARWLDALGDPRNGKVDMVDWIEMIPLRETRNYVQRIMEGLVVYRERMTGSFKTVPPAVGRS